MINQAIDHQFTYKRVKQVSTCEVSPFSFGLVNTFANETSLDLRHNDLNNLTNDRNLGRAIEAIGKLIKWYGTSQVTVENIKGCAKLIREAGLKVSVNRLTETFFSYLVLIDELDEMNAVIVEMETELIHCQAGKA